MTALTDAHNVRAADFHASRAVVGGVERGQAILERRGEREHLEGGARRVEREGCAVVHGGVRTAAGVGGLDRRLDVRVVERGGAGPGEHGAAARVEGDDGAHAAGEGLLGCTLDARVDGELDRVARLADAGERVEGVLPARVILGPRERVVLRVLDAHGAVLLGVVAHHVCGEVAVGVGAGVRTIGLLDGLGERQAIRGDDRAALDEARLVDGVVVARHVLILGRLDHLDIGDVADEHGEQRGEQEHGAGQAVGERHAAEQAALGCVEGGAAHVGATHGGAVAGGGQVGARVGDFGRAAGCLVTGAQQQGDDHEAREQGGAALAHEGQGHAGERDELGHAAHDGEGLEGDGRGEAGGGEGRQVGLGTRGGGEAADREQHEQQQHGGAAEQAHLLADRGEDHIGGHDGDDVGHALADADAREAAVCQGEQ